MNVGIIVPHMGASQISFTIIKEMDKIKAHDKILFFENLMSSIIKPSCAMLCVNELGHFKGNLITTNIENTLLALNICNRKAVRIYFYVWDLEWIRRNRGNYLYNLPAYKDVNHLIVRSNYHVGPVENYSNRKPIVIEDFNLEEILRCHNE
jgi:hypothetical protein